MTFKSGLTFEGPLPWEDPMSEIEILRGQVEALETEVDELAGLLGDAEHYVQHKSTCARLLTKRECDCGLVELMTRVHAELEDGDDDDEEELEPEPES